MTIRIACALLLALAAPAAADVRITVVDVAGDLAYVEPGATAGLVPGAAVEIGAARLVVHEVTASGASIRLDGARVKVGATGSAASTSSTAATEIARKPAPTPLASYAGMWPDAVRPATQQQVTPVPLGGGAGSGGTRVTVIGAGFGAIQRGGSAAQAEGRVIASFELMHDRPLAADVDIAGRVYADGSSGSRSPLNVRAAQVRYGSASDPRLAVGRLRYAAASVGMLDGARVAAKVQRWELAAFGGLVPDPLSGRPTTSVARFGVETSYAGKGAWTPRASLTATGSTWEGQSDERRLSLSGSAARGGMALDGWADVQAFAADNPWGAARLELTGAGASTSWRRGGTRAGVDVTFLRPERTLRLRAALPGELSPDEAYSTASLSLGHRTARWSLDASGFVGRTVGQTISTDSAGLLRGELRRGMHRAIAGVSAGQSAFASYTALELGAGTGTADVDVELRYRPELVDYAASTGPLLQHALVLDVRYAASPALDLATSLSALAGGDRDALVLGLIAVWRPLP